jgi:hypothetical protein
MKPTILIPVHNQMAQSGMEMLREALPDYEVIVVYGMSGSALIIPPVSNDMTETR